MLVAAKAETESTIYQVLYKIRVNIVRMRWHTFGVVMPYRNAQPIR